MKVKTEDLIDAALDWAVAKAEGLAVETFIETDGTYFAVERDGPTYWPSTDWGQGGPITVENRISIHYCVDLRDRNGKYVHAEMETHSYHGYSKGHDEPLVAAMRCYVASKLGNEVDVPEDLT